MKSLLTLIVLSLMLAAIFGGPAMWAILGGGVALWVFLKYLGATPRARTPRGTTSQRPTRGIKREEGPTVVVRHFGQFVAGLREARGTTVDQLATFAQVSRSTITRGEKNAHRSWHPETCRWVLRSFDDDKPLTRQEHEAFCIAGKLDPDDVA